MSLALALLALAPQSVGSWTTTELSKLRASDAEELDQFGRRLCVDGDTAAVLARLGGPSDDGAVYVLEQDPSGAWTETAVLAPAFGEPAFGEALALSGDVIVVGNAFAGGSGAAFVFERDAGGPDAWGQVAHLVASDGTNSDRFGTSAAVWGHTLVIGAPLDNHGKPSGSAFGDGSVYVFERQLGAWIETQKLVASDAQPSQTVAGDGFGNSLALEGDTLVVGSPGYLGPGSGLYPGAVYVFNRTGADPWSETARLQPLDHEVGSEFGGVVDLSGNLLAAAAPKATSTAGAKDAGAVYLFESTAGSWSELAKLVGSGIGANDKFGASLDLAPTRLVVGAPDQDATGQIFAGAAYAFERDQDGASAWGQVARLTASDPFQFDDFGLSVAATPTGALIGAPSDGEGVSTVYGVDSMAYDPVSNTWYGLDEQQNLLLTLDPTRGWGTTKTQYLAAGINTIAWDPIGGTLYGTEAGKLYAVNTSTGGSSQLATTGSSYWADGLTFDTLRNRLVGVSAYYRTLIAFDPVTGAATEPLLGYNSIEGLAYDPVAGVLYGCDGSDLLTIDTSTGKASPVGPLGLLRIEALAFDPGSGTLYGADNVTNQLVTIDTATGTATPVGSLGITIEITGLAFDTSTGLLFGVNRADDSLVSIDPAAAAMTAIGPFGNRPIEALTYDAATGRLYGMDVGTNSLVLFNTSTGSASGLGTMVWESVTGLAFDRGTGTLFGVDKRFARLITIDGNSGAAQSAAPLLALSDLQSLAYDPIGDRLLAIDMATDQLVSIDPVSWATQIIAPVPPKSIESLALDPATGKLLGWDRASGELIDIDTVTGTTAGIGAVDGSLSLGSLYPYEFEFPPATYCTAGVSAAGCQASIGASGTASASAGSGFELNVTSIEGQKTGQFYFGTNGIQANPWGPSLQCVVPPVVRCGLLAPVGTSGACDGGFTQDLNALFAAKPGKNPGPGVFVQAQFWYRDPASTGNVTTNLSNGIEFYLAP